MTLLQPRASADQGPQPGSRSAPSRHAVGYKWIALSNTTLGMLMATINSSITLIALPDIFRGIGVDPLAPGDVGYLLWMLMGFLVVTAVLVVAFGRIGDIFGRVRMYELGFAVFSSGLGPVVGRLAERRRRGLLSDRHAGRAGPRGGDAHGELGGDPDRRVPYQPDGAWRSGSTTWPRSPARSSGSCWAACSVRSTGASCSWSRFPSASAARSGPISKLEERGIRRPARIDWWGTVTFAVGLVSLLVGITYGIQPYGHDTMGWANPVVIAELAGGVAVLVAFCVIETLVAQPMFHLPLFKIKAFAAGNVASLLASLGRGGLMFILIIWLQGIWLPLHGYSFSSTPLWAGIYMVPLTVGFLVSGPISGFLSDRFGPRPFASAGMVLSAASFLVLEVLPVDFSYVWFALLLLALGASMGLFASPNRAQVMNSLPPDQRGVGSGMAATFQNSAMVLSIGRVLQPHDPRPGRLPSGSPVLGPEISRRAGGRRDADRAPSAGRAAVRGLPRRQPDACAPRPDDSSDLGGTCPAAVEPELLPGVDLRAVRERPAPGVRLCRWRLPGRRARLLAERGALRAPGAHGQDAG